MSEAQVEVPSVTVQSIKKALSINKDFDPFLVNLKELVEKQPFIAKRPECETDTASLQLIPYITLVDTSGGELKYFIYTRGKSSGEQRLAGKCSIGLGGHIEEIELTDVFPNAIVNSIAMAAVREVQEEIGLKIPFHIFSNAMVKDYAIDAFHTDNELYISNAKVLYNTFTPTDVVHLGISFVVRAKPSDIKDLELDVITRGRWMTYKEIEEAEMGEDPIELEIWSKVVIARVNLSNAVAGFINS